MAVPARARTAFLGPLPGAAATRSGHVTDAILSSGPSRSWTAYFWFPGRGRWSWPQVWHAPLGVLTTSFAPAVRHVVVDDTVVDDTVVDDTVVDDTVVDDTVVERLSTRAPGSMIHHDHTAKPNRPPFLRGRGWLCLAAVVERGFKVGAVPLMPRLVRRGANRGKLESARFLLRLLGHRLGQVRLLPDACLVHARLADPVHARWPTAAP